jgi:hypothetical protein
MKRAGALVASLLIACGSSEADPSAGPSDEKFALLVSSEPVLIQAPTTMLVKIVVAGAGGAPVSIAATNLPAFATLSESVLTLSPTLADAGEYAVTLTATAGPSQDSATLLLHVFRVNTPPMWRYLSIQDADMHEALFGMTLTGTALLRGTVCDSEADAMTVDAEVVPIARPFTGVPTHTFPAPATLPMTGDEWPPPPGGCAYLYVPLDGLAAPESYKVRLSATDALGAVAFHSFPGFGTDGVGTFSLAP